jgi:hypothetical protein
MNEITYDRRAKGDDGHEYEKVLPGDRVLYDGRLYHVNNAVGLDPKTGVQVATLIWVEELAVSKNRMTINVRADLLKIVEDHHEDVYWGIWRMWNHVTPEEREAVLEGMGFRRMG